MTFHRQGCLLLVLLTNGLLLCGCQQVSDRVAAWKSPAEKKANEQAQQLLVARIYEKEGKLREAAQAYQELHQKYPKNAEVCHRLAVVQVKQGNMTESDALFQQALALNPHSADVLTDYGYAQYLQGNYEESEQLYRRALKETPTHKRATTNLAVVMGHQGEFDESFGLFKRVVSEAEAHANLGYIHVQRGEGQLAIKRYSTALDIDPELKSASEALVEIAELQKRIDRPNRSPFEQDDVKLASKTSTKKNQPRKGNPEVLIEDIVDAQPNRKQKIETVEWAQDTTKPEKQLASAPKPKTQTLEWEQEAGGFTKEEVNPFAPQPETEEFDPTQESDSDLQNFPAAQKKPTTAKPTEVASTELKDDFPWSGTLSATSPKEDIATEEQDNSLVELPLPSEAKVEVTEEEDLTNPFAELEEVDAEENLENPFAEDIAQDSSADTESIENPFAEETPDTVEAIVAETEPVENPFAELEAPAEADSTDEGVNIDVADSMLTPFATEEVPTEEPVEELPVIKELHAFRGYCPVMLRDERMLVKAKPEHTLTLEGVTYEFSSDAAKIKFEQTPRLYEAVAAGLDVVMLIENDERVPGSIAHGQWYQKQLYLFNSRESMEKFVEDPNRYVLNSNNLAAN